MARSLHSRFVIGAAFWTIGVLAAAIATAVAVVTRYPHSALIVHDGLLALGGAALVTAGLSVIRRGLSPVSMLRARLDDVRNGRTDRLEGEYPAEVAPLVDDLNRLLDDRERRVARAAARAGDLAHGLKTPLAILTQEIARAEAAGQLDLAASIRQQVMRMRRQVESHLAQARAAAGGASSTERTNVGDAVAGLVRTMERLYADRKLAIQTAAPHDCVARVPLEDLEEMVGNLLDNACKWTKSRIVVSAATAGGVVITVDDDGAGLNPAMRQQVLERGVRADEAAPGSGLGLGIVRDLAEAYGGSISLEQSSLGGVSARLTLPA